MKILFDISNILYASYLGNYDDNFQQGFTEEDLENFVRNNSIRFMYNIIKTFKEDWKNLIICADLGSWRKDYFKFYKANRKKSRKESEIDFGKVNKFFGLFINELKDILPGIVLQISNCEADDIIATLTFEIKNKETVVIVSKDKDFIQLKSNNVFIYEPFKRSFIEEIKLGSGSSFEIMKINNEKDAKKYLLYHILLGDSTDGIPNLKSDDDAFYNPSKRQTAFGIKTILKNIQNKDDLKKYIDEFYDNWKRNVKMIDLTKIPQEYKDKILFEYNNEVEKCLTKELNLNKILQYCEKYCLYDLEEIFKRF